ncbi:MAG: thioredoxin family protein, partial [Ottowia sp.]|nr:thioredoxin family protein [Ottowia sp.]
PQPMQAHLEVTSLGKALLLGLLAGLILNCMPCVLPVLTLKTSVLFVVGGAEDAARRRAFREHNLLFACGILTQFLILAVGLGAAGLIWGQLFQSVALVTAMLIVVFLLGLSMLGVFTLPVIDLKAGSAASPRLNAYLTGIMATLLATPCSGPLLGGVLSWAFSQPLILLVLVFLAVGVGMSLPYLLFAYKPGLAVYLPRPGAWMGVLERLVGFFLLGTSLYLLSVLPQDRHLPLLAALLVVAAGGWVWGRFGGYDAPPLRRRFLGCAMALLTVVVVVHASQTSTPVVHWAEFSATDVRTHLGKKLILLEFTADWCPSCKFMEQAVFTQERLRRWQKRYQVELVRVDLTRPNPAAEALLQELGSSSIPLTAVFPAGSGATAPLVLRDIFTAATLEQALRRAFDKGS